MIGIVSQFGEQHLQCRCPQGLSRIQHGIDHVKNRAQLSQGLLKQVREGGFGGDPLIPGVTPGLMVQVQTPGRILYYIGDQLAGGHGILQENGFKELDLILLAAVSPLLPRCSPKTQSF